MGGKACRAHRGLRRRKREAPHGCARDCAHRQVQLRRGQPRGVCTHPPASRGREVWLLRGSSPRFEHGPLYCHVEDLQDNVPGLNLKETVAEEAYLAELEGHVCVCQGAVAPCCTVLSPRSTG